jgi:tRNA wybutosine-synthesizing protein 2
VTRLAPIERVRARLSEELTPDERRSLPDGFQRLGSVLIVKLPETLRPRFGPIGAAYRAELGVESVLRRRGPIAGEFRLPSVELIAGATTETQVRENGVVYRFDAARTMFAAGNRAERSRLAGLVRPGEAVADLFAGIGYFTLPIAIHSRVARIDACEANPTSFAYLKENLRRNRVADRVVAHLGPNESAPLAEGAFDRVLLGYLPSALPWVPRAVRLIRAEGGTLHVHQVVGSRDGVPAAEASARTAVERAGVGVLSCVGRSVKPYGPGRLHAVVDVRVAP